MKHLLDDWSREVILERFPAEDYQVSNLKLFFGGLSCLLGIYAHYGVGKWPESKFSLILCVAFFLVFQWILSYVAQNIQKDYILRTQLHLGLALKVRSDLDKNGYFTLQIEDARPDSTKPNVKMTKSVTEFFDCEGKFYSKIFKKEVLGLLRQWSA
eukprot:TRINITY_DN2971_c0_g2_i2.p1 TRINITY_DN2971_c0_g2~~TRINITY_DN2971_c0_g2_i2.p1  ORF type:complete len:156 (-),score=29.44 TRINITY_DN2971_c0_g2_i2:140-607(-)